MHTLILAKRSSIAQSRILGDAALLADHFGVDQTLVAALAVQEKDAVVRAMKEREAVANLLSAIAITVGVRTAIAPAEETTDAVSDVTEEAPADSEDGDDPAPKKTRGKKAS